MAKAVNILHIFYKTHKQLHQWLVVHFSRSLPDFYVGLLLQQRR